MSQMLALVIIVGILFIGDVVAVRTKAWIPSVFVCAVLFLLGFWTFFPPEIVSLAGIPPAVATMMIYLLITNMGTLLSIQQLKAQWKTIVISISGILGIVVALFESVRLSLTFKLYLSRFHLLLAGLSLR